MSQNQNQSPLGIKAAAVGGVFAVIAAIVGAMIQAGFIKNPFSTNNSTQYIINHIKEKKKFRVRLDETVGTLKSGVHSVIYENPGFVSYGVRVDKDKYWCAFPGYDSAILDDNQITLWNQPFTFDKDKNIYLEKRIVGKLDLNDNFDTKWRKNCQKRQPNKGSISTD